MSTGDLSVRSDLRPAVLIVDDTPAKLARSYGNLIAVRAFQEQV